MRQLADQQKIVVFISHRMNEVKSVADRVTVFRNGSDVGVRTMRDTSSDELVSLMLGREMLDYFPKKESHVQEEVILETRGLGMAIRENITLPILGGLKRRGLVSSRREREVVLDLMRVLKVKAESMEARVGTLSGGNQQKVVIAKLLSTHPGIFLMYDLIRGVDVGTKTEIFHLVRDLARQGNGILYYSTTTDELVHVCDRVIVMHDGRINAELAGERLSKENIIRASLGEATLA